MNVLIEVDMKKLQAQREDMLEKLRNVSKLSVCVLL